MMNEFSAVASSLGIAIEYLESTTSTNDVAARGQYNNADVVLAEHQSHGRGQKGNVWSSTKSQNLTFSLVVARDIDVYDNFYISRCVALGIVAALTIVTGEQNIKVKWPNDIYVFDKKVCGILIENDIRGSKISRSVVGIGLNVNQREFDPSLPNPTSLSEICGKELSRPEVLKLVLESIAQHLDMLEGGRHDELAELYMQNLYRCCAWHSFRIPKEGTITARIIDIKDDGCLVVECEDNSTREFYFKEIEYII